MARRPLVQRNIERMETSLKLSDFIRYTAPVKRFRPNWTAAFGGIEERGATRDEAEARARVHLAQYVLDDMLGGADFTTEEIAKIILEPGDQRDFFSLAARSIEVKMLMATGLTWQEANIQLDGLHLQRSR